MALPALDDSPTLPHPDLPGGLAFLPPLDYPTKLTLEEIPSRSASPLSAEYLLSTLAVKDAFPSLVLEAIDGGSVDAGTRARAARRVDNTRVIMGGSWRPFTQPERRSSDPETLQSTQRPPLKSHHTSPPSFSSASSSSSGSGPSSPAQLLFPGGSTRPGMTRTRYHTVPPPIQVHNHSMPLTPLHSIPETPKDLDVSPEGSWALRQSRTLGRSRSHPNLRQGHRQLLSSVEVHDIKLKRSMSSSGDKGDAVERKKKAMMAVLQMRRGSARPSLEPSTSVLMARVDSSTRPISTPKTNFPPLPASPLRRSPRIQSLTSAIPKHIRSSFGSIDYHAPSSSSPLATHTNRARSSSAPTPANQLRDRLQKEKEEKEKVVSSQSANAIIPDRSAARGPAPPKLVLSREDPSNRDNAAWEDSEMVSPRYEKISLKSEMVQDIFYTPEVVPCLTPDCDTPTEELVLGQDGRFTGAGMDVVEEEPGEEREELVIRPGSVKSEATGSEDGLDALWAFPAPPTRSNPSTPCTPTYHREPAVSPRSSPPSSPIPTSSFTSRSQPDLLLSFSSAGLENESTETLVTPNTFTTPLKPGSRKTSSVMGAASASMVSLLSPNEFGSTIKNKGGRLAQLEKQEKGEKDDPKRFKTWTGSITKARKSMGKLWV
ncbi:hypothetical protein B9479_001166 [Cryptococcus floricola]|uniref:Uncharacterized protein n=1 Tax=Cryptococcus floricola TaxID=2591691 RepID=A0A5D3B681_9TREE|nr:hypothetical protein B9479_001166 [Cryptococcus floricola]